MANTLCSDYHTRNCDFPMMLGAVTALTKTTKENGATIVIPGSHVWGPDRCPYDHEAIPAELNPGDSLFFVCNTYHAGGGNITKYAHPLIPHEAETANICYRDEYRETVGIFLMKP